MTEPTAIAQYVIDGATREAEQAAGLITAGPVEIDDVEQVTGGTTHRAARQLARVSEYVRECGGRAA
jgi:hypothetical protein